MVPPMPGDNSVWKWHFSCILKIMDITAIKRAMSASPHPGIGH